MMREGGREQKGHEIKILRYLIDHDSFICPLFAQIPFKALT